MLHDDILRELIPAAAISRDRKAELLYLLDEADPAPEAQARVEAAPEIKARVEARAKTDAIQDERVAAAAADAKAKADAEAARADGTA
jgi:hypothetical protein